LAQAAALGDITLPTSTNNTNIERNLTLRISNPLSAILTGLLGDILDRFALPDTRLHDIATQAQPRLRVVEDTPGISP